MTQWGLDNLFNPGKRHMDDEKRRLQSTREEIGDASGGRRIDLEGGKVSISVPRPAAPAVEDDTEDDATADDTALEPALEAEQVPAVALASDETEIVPEVAESVEAVAPESPAELAAAEPEPVAAPAPAADAAAARRRTQSARAWSRGG